MPRVRALGKVDELLEKAHWWMTGEIDRDEERREKPPNQQKEEREKLHSGIIYTLLSFYFGTVETVEWRKWRFPVLLLFLSPATTKVNRVVVVFFLFPKWGGDF